MTKISKITVLFAAFLLLCSCAKMPESLKETEPSEPSPPAVVTALVTDEAGNTVGTESIPLTPCERGDVAAIRAQLDYDLQKTYKNITVERARVGSGVIMPSYDIKIGGKTDFDISGIVQYLYSEREDISDKSSYIYMKRGDPMDKRYPAWEEPVLYNGEIFTPNALPYDLKSFSPTDEQTYCTVWYSNGSVWGSETARDGAGDGYYFETKDIVKEYDLDFEQPDMSLSYKMYDGEDWNAQEAIDFVESFWNDYLSGSDDQDFGYKVKTLYVLDLGGGRYGYLFQMQRYDENGNFYDVERRYYPDTKAIESGGSFMIKNNLMTWCSEKEVITRYIKNYSFTLKDSTDGGDNLLSLGAASDILSEGLAQNINLSLTAELSYVVICKGYPFYSQWEYPEYYEDICLDRCEFEIAPYWCFRTKQCTLTDDPTEIYFVNANTGELSVMQDGEYSRR